MKKEPLLNSLSPLPQNQRRILQGTISRLCKKCKKSPQNNTTKSKCTWPGNWNRLLQKILRTERTCKWCSLTLGSDELEDESHMLFSCDLYASHQTKLIKLLNNTLTNANTYTMLSETDHENVRLAFENINYSSLNTNFHKLQSTCNTHCSVSLNPPHFLLRTQHHYANKTENRERY